MSGDAKKTTGAGVSKEAIECRWFEAPSAPSVVRLIARERRWSGRSNLDWQGEYLSDVVAFVRESLGGGVLPVIVTPAGTLTATLEQEVTFTDEGWAAARSDLLQQIHGCLPHGNTKATQPLLGDRVANAYKQRYRTLRDAGHDPEEIYDALVTFTLSEVRSSSSREAAAQVVLSYFFFSCDIFEDAPVPALPAGVDPSAAPHEGDIVGVSPDSEGGVSP